jgi:hypothetical protein
MTVSSSSSFSALRRRHLLVVAVAVSLSLLSSQVAVVVVVVAQAPAPTTFIFTDTTAAAPASVGNVAGPCSGYDDCRNGCRSTFYRVTGGPGSITASTCGTTNFHQRFYVWQGTDSDCSTFACIGTYPRSRRANGRFCACAWACACACAWTARNGVDAAVRPPLRNL